MAFAASARLTGLHVTTEPEQSHIVLSLSGNTPYHVFTLDNPYRLVVDLPGTRIATEIEPAIADNSSIYDVRAGRPEPDTLRIVFDLKAPRRPNVSLIRGVNPGTKHLVIDLDEPGYHPPVIKKVVAAATPKVASEKKISINEEQMLQQAVQEESQVDKTHPGVLSKPTPAPTPVTTAAVKTPTPTKKPAAEVSAFSLPLLPALLPSPTQRPIIIIIDPGHGGKDPGTTGHFGVHEKNVVLTIGTDLFQLLQKDPRFHPVMTRAGDYFLTLRQRLSVARQNHGDVFIGIHADRFKDPYATGASVFALSAHGASSEAAHWLAQKENYSELGGVTLTDKSDLLRSVLLDLSQTATISASVQLGDALLQQLGAVGKLHSKAVDQAPFMVLKSPDIPSVLVETGFLSNTSEEERLRNPLYQQQIAQSLYNGIVNYFTSNPLPGTLLTAELSHPAKR